MSITTDDLRALAQQLLSDGSEVARRSSVSRGYYAAYHFALNWESKLPCPGSEHGPAGGVHQKLINRLSNPAPECTQGQKSASKKLGIRLNWLKSLRHTADYDLESAVEAPTATQALTSVDTVLQTL